MRANASGMVTMALLAAAWELVVRLALVDYQYLPAPSAVLTGAGDLLASNELLPNLLHTTTVTLVGWAVASLIGVGLGVVLGVSPGARRYSMTTFEVTRAVPAITLIPATLLIFGFSLRMELVIVVYIGIWPVLLSTVGGVAGVPRELLDLARMLRLSRSARLTKIILPSAMPAVVVGVRLALSLCLVLAVVAEMIGNPAGLGHALIRAQQALQPDEMFAYVLTTGILGIALNACLRSAASRLLPSGDAGRAQQGPGSRAL